MIARESGGIRKSESRRRTTLQRVVDAYAAALLICIGIPVALAFVAGFAVGRWL